MSDVHSHTEDSHSSPASEHPQEQQQQNALIVGDRSDLHVGDYVGFERITPNREWRLSLGKVVGFPTSRTVKVAHYDPINKDSLIRDPASEAALRERAEQKGKMKLWNQRDSISTEHIEAVKQEQEATTRFFGARDQTLEKQAEASQMTVEAYKSLQASRKEVKKVPARQWRDLRTREAPESIVKVMRALMLVLYEDKAVSWEAMQAIMREPNFMDRVHGWDCTSTPMSFPRRQKILALCSNETKPNRSTSARDASTTVPPAGVETGSYAAVDAAVRQWLNSQLLCSEMAEAQERKLDECFAEQQEQRVLIREVNDMRTNISRLEVQMFELKCKIMGIDCGPKPVMPLEAYPTDTIFYKRTYPDSEGRFVQEVILRESVLVNFGPLTTEDAEGYVRLSKEQADVLRSAVLQSLVHHDANEMQDLLARKEREEQEIEDLRARIAELRAKSSLTPEEEEELAQLEKLLEDAERRHRATLARIADLYACGRGAREITTAQKRIECRYTRLHCKMSGDWEEILNDPEYHKQMQAAFLADVSRILAIPEDNVFDVDARCGSLLIDFTVKHSGELDDDELQNLINNGDFSSLSLFYEKVTFKKTYPLNTPEQEAAYLELERQLAIARKRAAFSGMGERERLEDYYNADGTLDEDFSDEIKNHPDYRVAMITIPIVREDFDEAAFIGPQEKFVADEELPPAAAVQEPVQQEEVKPVDTITTDEIGASSNQYGLTETQPAEVYEEL